MPLISLPDLLGARVIAQPLLLSVIHCSYDRSETDEDTLMKLSVKKNSRFIRGFYIK